MSAYESIWPRFAVFSRSVQAAVIYSVALHILLGLVLLQLYEPFKPLIPKNLTIEIDSLTFLEFEEVEENVVAIEPLLETEFNEPVQVEAEEQEDEPIPETQTVEAPPVIAIDSTDNLDAMAFDDPVAVIVATQTLEEFARQDSEHLRVPPYKTFEEQLRQESYFTSWAEKVTRFGLRAIPSTVTQRVIHGEVTLDVVLNKDGALEHVEIIEPTHLSFLNTLSLNIVRMAAPYAPVPRNLLNSAGRLQFQPKIVFRNKLAWVE